MASIVYVTASKAHCRALGEAAWGKPSWMAAAKLDRSCWVFP